MKNGEKKKWNYGYIECEIYIYMYYWFWHTAIFMALSENRSNPIVPNGFADHYPY
jgi:hypothetical protein